MRSISFKNCTLDLSGAQPPELPHAEEVCMDDWAESSGHSLVHPAKGRQVRSLFSCWHKVTLGHTSQCVGKGTHQACSHLLAGVSVCRGRDHPILLAFWMDSALGPYISRAGTSDLVLPFTVTQTREPPLDWISLNHWPFSFALSFKRLGWRGCWRKNHYCYFIHHITIYKAPSCSRCEVGVIIPDKSKSSL